jgi:hypothetical protein
MKTQNIASRLDPQNNTKKLAQRSKITLGDLRATQVDQTQDLLFTNFPVTIPVSQYARCSVDRRVVGGFEFPENFTKPHNKLR